MKAQRIKKATVLAMALFMFAGTNIYAQRGRNYQDQDRGFAQKQHCMIPDLTEDQQNKMDALRVNHLKEMKDFRNQMNELRARKHTLQTSDNVDLKEINAVIDKMTAVHNQMMKQSAKHRQEIRSLLTDEQKVYFDSRPMRGERNGRGHGRRNGYRDGSGFGQGNGQGYGKGINAGN
jgi:Spy/CpxP family protein refolding chaperone